MNNFRDRVFLLLTLKKKEFNSYYYKTNILLVILSVYNLAGLFLPIPRPISYWSIFLAFILVLLFFVFLNSKRLDINWKLIELAKQQAKEGKGKKEKEETKEEPVVEEVHEEPSDNEIQLIEEEEEKQHFDFADSLTDLYNFGSAEDLSDAAVNGTTNKVRRMII